MTGLLWPAARGAIAGAVATGPMTAFMMLTRRQGRTPEIEPRLVEQWVTRATGTSRKLSEDQEVTLAGASHVAFGAAAGLLYGCLQRFLPLPAVITGVAVGLVIWAVSYAGWIPALGILPPPTKEPKETTARRVTMHAIYGASMGLAYDLLGRVMRRRRAG
jgi:uncharacterized membrane protein YagU involved in acid resistance